MSIAAVRLFFDDAVVAVAKLVVNKVIGNDGEIISLRVDRERKAIRLCVELRRDKETVDVDIVGYEFSKVDGECIFSAKKFKSSKKWIEEYCNEHFSCQQIHLPGFVFQFLATLLGK